MALRDQGQFVLRACIDRLYCRDFDFVQPVITEIEKVFKCLTNSQTQRVKLCLGGIKRLPFRKGIGFFQHDG